MEKLAVLIDRKATAATEVEPTPVVAPTNSYEDNLRFIQSKTPSDWFAAARWAKTEDTLSTYQRRLLYLIGTYITDIEEIDEVSASAAVEAFTRLLRMGFVPE